MRQGTVLEGQLGAGHTEAVTAGVLTITDHLGESPRTLHFSREAPAGDLERKEVAWAGTRE